MKHYQLMAIYVSVRHFREEDEHLHHVSSLYIAVAWTQKLVSGRKEPTDQ